MISLDVVNKEVRILLTYEEPVGGKPRIMITGTADLSHHLIEGVFDLVDRLARMERCSHQSSEWRKK